MKPIFVEVFPGVVLFAGMVDVEQEEAQPTTGRPKCSCNFGPGCSVHDRSLHGHISRAVKSFEKDPPDSDYQTGYIGALLEISALVAEGRIDKII